MMSTVTASIVDDAALGRVGQLHDMINLLINGVSPAPTDNISRRYPARLAKP